MRHAHATRVITRTVVLVIYHRALAAIKYPRSRLVSRASSSRKTVDVATIVIGRITGAKGIALLHHFHNFRHFFHFHKNLSGSVLSGTNSLENRFPPKRKKRPKIAKHTPYQNETQFSSSSLKNTNSGHARPPKSAFCPPVISGAFSRENSHEFPYESEV